DIKRFKAIDKSVIRLDNLISKGIVEDGAYYSISAIGNALSHISIWNKSIRDGKIYTIFEDDAVICKNF
ncbi:glycosyltransferase family 25 protein, partial [Acetobacter orleanensis]